MKHFVLFCLGILRCSYADDIRERLFKNGPCDSRNEFRCFNDQCIERRLFCDGKKNCRDGSDEDHCSYKFYEYSYVESRCPTKYPFFKCATTNTYDKCIPQHWKCDGIIDCKSGLDEKDCRSRPVNENLKSLELPKLDAIKWLKGISKKDGTERWSDQVHRIAVAFNLAGAKLSSELTSELAYEVKIQLLSKLVHKGIQPISSSDIALYIHALLVTCGNPREFHSFNLVAELRKRINARNYVNPYIILAMCNAGDPIDEKDIEKLANAFYSNHTEFWSDTQAFAIMALTCAARQMPTRYNISDFEEMVLDLKKNQTENGLVENLKTTSLVMQALFAAEEKENKDQFDEEKAIKQLLLHQQDDGSFGNFINTYYTLPVFNYRHFGDINSNHCPKSDKEEEKVLYRNWFHGFGTKYNAQYSLWIGDQKEIQKSLRLQIPTNTSLYTLMKMAASVDDKYKFETNVKDGKPFIYSLSDMQDDPESGKFWFLYIFKGNALVPIKSSPMDFTVENNQHFVHWFRLGSWH